MTKRLESDLCGPATTRRVLALDGGGVRGLITLGILQELEDHLRQRYNKDTYRLCDYFDLIGGTSTGSIIATGLALGMSVGEISALYKLLIPKIFKDASGQGVFAPKFKNGPLAQELADAFGGKTLASPELRCGLAIHCKRIDTGSAWILVNNPRWHYYESNCRFRLRDLVQASAAAPHFFEGVLLSLQEEGNADQVQDMFFIDGGVGGNNNPALEMFMAVRDPAYGFGWDLGPDKLYLLSVGTGWLRERHDAKNYRSKTFVTQTLNALRGMINDVSLQQIALMQGLSESGERWFINSEKGDQATAPYLTVAGASLHYQRIDVRLDPVADDKNARPEHAQRLVERPLTQQEVKRLRDITSANGANLKLLNDLGVEAGLRYMKAAPPPGVFDPAGLSRASAAS
ncbi:MAG: patatin-like phospholipase family protein [Caulobacterales bacterium]